MKTRNIIISRHRASLREERLRRRQDVELLITVRPTQLITLEEYCPTALNRPLDLDEMLDKIVQAEDHLNHANVEPFEIPKLTYPKTKPWGLVAVFTFGRSIVRASMP